MSVEPSAPAPASDFTKPYRLQYQLGVYLATNAIPDSYAVIDGPDCLFRKAEWVHGKHDLCSTLLDVFGNHRIVSTLINAEAVIKDRGEMVAERVKQVGKIDGAAAVFVCAMPHVMIIGTQYDRILRSMEDQVPMDLMEVPSLSLQGDWLDGYVETMASIATQIDLTGGVPDANTVAIIGHVMDRTEPDALADVAELKRLFDGIDLDVSAIWLSDTPYRLLAAVKDAGTLVALPSGRKAAKILAARTGATVVEVPTPFGPARTRRMLLEVARATGKLPEYESFTRSELRRIVPRLEWSVRHLFFGKSMVFAGRPDLLGGLYSLATEVGMRVKLLATSTRKEHMVEDLEAEFGPMPPVLFAPTQGALARVRREIDPNDQIDIAVGDSHFFDLYGQGPASFEMGFPSHFDHALFERPHLGFRGWLCFLDRVGQVLGRRPMPRARRRAEEDRQAARTPEPAREPAHEPAHEPIAAIAAAE